MTDFGGHFSLTSFGGAAIRIRMTPTSFRGRNSAAPTGIGVEMASTHTNSRRLIEDWFPVNEISIEAIRERAGAVPNPAPHQLHVWWARRPLAPSRAAIAASLLSGPPESSEFYGLLGTHPGIVDEHQNLDEAKIQSLRLKQGFSKPRAFTHNLSETEREWLNQNLVTENPVVLDITAGGGSIPFEAGRLGFKTIANELNPVAGLILRATCEWPQKYGSQLLNHYQEISDRFLNRVGELTANLYPEEPQPKENTFPRNTLHVNFKRETQACLFARTVTCPHCAGIIPLSPTWRLNSKGTGIRLIPDISSGICSFEIVSEPSQHSSPTKPSRTDRATCPYPNCGTTTPKGYISKEAQAGRLGQQLYCIIYRDSWYPITKSGRPWKKPKTSRGFRIPTPDDDNARQVEAQLEKLATRWDRDNILPTEEIQNGDKTKTPLDYGMPKWRDMFNPRQLLAHGYCVQAFHDLVNEDQARGVLDDTRKAAWCYVATAIDKLINRNSLLTRWDPGENKVAGTFDSHDFGMKWSYAEMPIANQGWGLEWSIDDTRDCLKQIIQMSGHQLGNQDDARLIADSQSSTPTALPSDIIIGPAQDTDLPSASIDAIVFDPPYHRNVNYAELSDFFYVWLKRTSGQVLKDNMMNPHLTDKVNEAIASPARFRQQARETRTSADRLATQDYKNKMADIFRECRRVIKPEGIMTVMFTHKDTDAWDALTIALIEAEFGITRTWPVKTEADTINTTDRAAARSTILLVCRPMSSNPTPEPWHIVETRIAQAVRADFEELQNYSLTPVDQYLAAFGPALQVISQHWGTERAVANPDRPEDEFAVTPTDALQVARREVIAHRTREISQRWAENVGDPVTRFLHPGPRRHRRLDDSL